MPDRYRVLVFGSRTWRNRSLISRTLNKILAEHPSLTVVHGACPSGADRIADDWARAAQDAGSDVEIEPHPADWDRWQKRAGFIRNGEMAALGADEALGFVMPCSDYKCRLPQHHGSHGSADMAERAERARIKVRTFDG